MRPNHKTRKCIFQPCSSSQKKIAQRYHEVSVLSSSIYNKNMPHLHVSTSFIHPAKQKAIIEYNGSPPFSSSLNQTFMVLWASSVFSCSISACYFFSCIEIVHRTKIANKHIKSVGSSLGIRNIYHIFIYSWTWFIFITLILKIGGKMWFIKPYGRRPYLI